ncbi:hypothetical protein [Mucisphaera calidilacus]|uniref:Uncharacterized protein n=1 Tax=Mucisphaera calidilacus TaxID=2527982 RepID=A0A518C0R4_9BACT|nr:hypothetical protein [Mucisphaera calidilacus]QDU72807.1 hypothetical protein Pan265_26810 [Mucisphaera calidilacus]
MLRFGDGQLAGEGESRLLSLERVTRVRRGDGLGGVAVVVASGEAATVVRYSVTVRCASSAAMDAAVDGVLSWSDGVERVLEDGSGRRWRDALLVRAEVASCGRVGLLWGCGLVLVFETGGMVRDA